MVSESKMQIMRDRLLRYAAARKAIGLVNKLHPGGTKPKHASRVFRNFNMLRKELLSGVY